MNKEHKKAIDAVTHKFVLSMRENMLERDRSIDKLILMRDDLRSQGYENTELNNLIAEVRPAAEPVVVEKGDDGLMYFSLGIGITIFIVGCYYIIRKVVRHD